MSEFPHASLKRCSKCGKEKPATIDYFHADRKKRSGFGCCCKQCKNQSRRKKIIKFFDPTKTKQCSQCGQMLPATTQYFHSHKKYADGLYYQCKACRSAIDEERCALPFEPLPDGYKKCFRCKQILPADDKHFYKDKRNRLDGLRGECIVCIARISKAKYQQAPLFQYEGMKICTKCKQSKPATPEYFHIRIVAKDGLEPSCKSCYSTYYRQWSHEHPDITKARRDRRRANLGGNEGVYTPEQIEDQLKRQKGKCYYCSKKFKKVKANGKWKYLYHIDHTFPLSRVSGIPANTIDYLVLACPSCNWSKGDKFPWEWPQGGRLL